MPIQILVFQAQLKTFYQDSGGFLILTLTTMRIIQKILDDGMARWFA